MPTEYRVEIVPPARADLDSIFEYISQDSLQYASAMIELLLAEITTLRHFPYRHGLIRGSKKDRPNTRSMVVYPYLVDYRIDEEKQIVYVMQVRHGARQNLG
jgi:addiction module RelE/StbE family toxin